MKEIEIPKTAQELVEKWLPNSKERLKHDMGDLYQTDDPIAFDLQEQYFIQEHFHEALRAFAEAVEKATKGNAIKEILSLVIPEEGTYSEAISDAIAEIEYAPSLLKTE